MHFNLHHGAARMPFHAMNHEPGRLRLTLSILAASLIALALCWMAAPVILGLLMGAVDPTQPSGVRQSFLLADMVLSALFTFGSAWLSIRMARRDPWIAALGVGLLCWLVYFYEVGGLSGMLSSQYPMWYEFFPTHWGAAALAAMVALRGERKPA